MSEATDRDEGDILQGVINVTLGGETVQIRELTIGETHDFRKVLGRTLSPYVSVLVTKKQEEWGPEVLQLFFDEGLDALVDLFFSYANELDREEILAKASEAELIEAAGEVLVVSGPLVRSILGLLTKMGSVMKA